MPDWAPTSKCWRRISKVWWCKLHDSKVFPRSGLKDTVMQLRWEPVALGWELADLQGVKQGRKGPIVSRRWRSNAFKTGNLHCDTLEISTSITASMVSEAYSCYWCWCCRWCWMSSLMLSLPNRRETGFYLLARHTRSHVYLGEWYGPFPLLPWHFARQIHACSQEKDMERGRILHDDSVHLGLVGSKSPVISTSCHQYIPL